MPTFVLMELRWTKSGLSGVAHKRVNGMLFSLKCPPSFLWNFGGRSRDDWIASLRSAILGWDTTPKQCLRHTFSFWFRYLEQVPLSHQKEKSHFRDFCFGVGMTGFEPAAPSSLTKCANLTALHPVTKIRKRKINLSWLKHQQMCKLRILNIQLFDTYLN